MLEASFGMPAAAALLPGGAGDSMDGDLGGEDPDLGLENSLYSGSYTVELAKPALGWSAGWLETGPTLIESLIRGTKKIVTAAGGDYSTCSEEVPDLVSRARILTAEGEAVATGLEREAGEEGGLITDGESHMSRGGYREDEGLVGSEGPERPETDRAMGNMGVKAFLNKPPRYGGTGISC